MHLTRPGSGPPAGRSDASSGPVPACDEALRLLVQRDNLRDTCLVADPDALAALAPGQARLRIEQFALTASNVTYAAFGEALNYWQFFPTSKPRFGCVPVWGFATVVESRAPQVAVGERCFGFWPMGIHHIAQPQQADGRGYVESAGHRQDLPPDYNRVSFCVADPGDQSTHEAHQALLRPLFVTSFLIDDFLAEQGFFGARQVLLSSASSKTAYGTALCLAGRRGAAHPGVQVTGLTGSANLAFTHGLACYDRVLCYDDLHELDPTVPTVYVDLSGNATQRLAVHRHFNGALSYSCAVGGTDWGAQGPGTGVPGPRPTLFLAPAQLRRRTAPPPEGWGAEVFEQRLQAAWQRLLARLAVSQPPWLQVHQGQGASAVRAAWTALVEGRADPRVGHMLSLQPRDSAATVADTQARAESAEIADTRH